MDNNLIIETKLNGYYIMKKFGHNLDYHFCEMNLQFSAKTNYQIGIRLINIYRQIHSAGYIYNDLKLENILVGDHTNSSAKSHELWLADFGFVSRYLDENGDHLP